MNIELFKKLLEITGQLKKYVVLRHDDKGFYIEYAFTEGAPHDNRCLDWYTSYQEEAYERNGWFKGMDPETKEQRKKKMLEERMKRVGKIFEISSFTCGWEEDPKGAEEERRISWEEYHPGEPFILENHICKVGSPANKCRMTHCPYWTYEEPVKCACWYLSSPVILEKLMEETTFNLSLEQVETLINSN